MTAFHYLAASVPWSAVGLLVGYLVGRGVRDLDRIAEAVTPEGGMPERKTGPKWLRRITSNVIIGVIVFILGITTVVQGYVQNEATRRVADCTRGYSNGFADAIDARSAASAAEREALVQWMRILDELLTKASPGGDPAAARQRFAQATSEYLQKQDALRIKQQENPFPDPPRDVCE
jgi:hypothetical protein